MTPKCSPIVLSATLAISGALAFPAAALASAPHAETPVVNLGLTSAAEHTTKTTVLPNGLGSLVAFINQNQNHDHNNDFILNHNHDHNHAARPAVHIHISEGEFSA